MPTIAALVINDGAAAAKTFNPSAQQGSKVDFSERSSTIAAGFKVITHELKKPPNKDGAHKIAMGYYMPTVATVSGVDVVVRSCSAKVELNLSQNSTLAERKDILAFVANSLDLPIVKSSVENIEPMF